MSRTYKNDNYDKVSSSNRKELFRFMNKKIRKQKNRVLKNMINGNVYMGCMENEDWLVE